MFALALANTGERFGYYTMLAIFTLFLQAKYGWTEDQVSNVYGLFLAAVYFMPVVGGWLADKIGYGKCVLTGISVMFLGYVCMSIPTPFEGEGMGGGLALTYGALLLIAVGTGLFKGNLQVMVGNLYDDPKYAHKRDSAFSLFYMAINIGAMFAPTAATKVYNFFLGRAGLEYNPEIPKMAHLYLDGKLENVETLAKLQADMPGADVHAMSLGDFSNHYISSLASSYNMGFAVACVSLILSITIYFACRNWFKHADVNAKQAAQSNAPVVELTPKQTKDRITALCLIFAVVIFFWMVFHQNGLSLTWFARDYTQSTASGLTCAGFNVGVLALLAVSIYTLFGIFQSESSKSKIACGVATALAWAGAVAVYLGMNRTDYKVEPQMFQHFNAFFVVFLTPISMAIFSALANKKSEKHPKGLEPSAPMKIGIGMMIAALGYVIMICASLGQISPGDLAEGAVSPNPVVPTYLISTYLVLTFAELLLSPMGISFVTKVAPPKYKGLMMGLWFAATAIGNYLTKVAGMLWAEIPLWATWTVFAVLCVVAGVIMFALLKKINAATES